MSACVVGVIGHVDHGKTALVRALTGQDTDRLPDERRRGMSIALGFAHLATAAGATVDLIDMPGHDRFVRTMIAGATGVDAVLLVVAANEGIRPQTIEHVQIAALLDLRRAVVAVTKCDLVEDRAQAAVAEAAADLLQRVGITVVGSVRTSSVAGSGIDALHVALDVLASEQRPRRADGIAFLPIDRAFSLSGHGTVVTGTLRGAPFVKGQRLELLPDRRTVLVRGLHVRGVPVERAEPGQRVAVNLRAITATDLKRGMALLAPGLLEPSAWVTLSLDVTADAPPLENGIRLRALMGTAEHDVRLRLLADDRLEPGASGLAQLHAATPLVIPAGEHVLLRLASPARTVAGGRVLEPVARRRRRRDAASIAFLRALRDLPAEAAIGALMEADRGAGTPLRELVRLTSLSPASVTERLRHMPVTVTRNGVVLRDVHVETAGQAIARTLDSHPEGLPLHLARACCPGLAAAVVDAALARLSARGDIVQRGGLISRAGRTYAASIAADEELVARRVERTLRDAHLCPPDPQPLLTDAATRRAVTRLLGEGVLIRATDRDKARELLFHREAVTAARQTLAPLLANGDGVAVSQVTAVLGVSRKFAMPLLDHLDRIRFTRRDGALRVRGAAYDT